MSIYRIKTVFESVNQRFRNIAYQRPRKNKANAKPVRRDFITVQDGVMTIGSPSALVPNLDSKVVSKEAELKAFACEIFQFIDDTNGSAEEFFQFLDSRKSGLRAQLTYTISGFISSTLESHSDANEKKHIASVVYRFASLIAYYPSGQEWLNQELAIAAFKALSKIEIQKLVPVLWSHAMNRLATIYLIRVHGNRAEDIERAIEASRQSLAITEQYGTSTELAINLLRLSAAYEFRIHGDRAENVEQAIHFVRQALTASPKPESPSDWALGMLQLGNIFRKRICGDRASNMDEAIDAYRQALTVIEKNAMPEEWAETMDALGTTYSYQICGGRADNMEKAIDAYQQALTVIAKSERPVRWAQITSNLAIVFYKRTLGDRAENVEKAIEYLKCALTIMTKSSMPSEWAVTMNHLGGVLQNRTYGDRAKNLEQAIAAHQQALTVMTQDAMPEEWSTTMMNLAVAYSRRVHGDRSENMEKSIKGCEQALGVRTLEAMPIEWMEAMHNLAASYSIRIQGNRAENIERAIDIYKRVVKFATDNNMPLEAAFVMTNLAVAYEYRIVGSQIDNRAEAAHYYRDSLKVLPPELYPHECRRAANSLSSLYSEQQKWDEALPVYQTAIQCSEILYRSANLLEGKSSVLTSTKDLYRRAAYAHARAGCLEKAVEILERGRGRDLRESLDRDRTDLSKLQGLFPEIYEKYRTITAKIRDLEVEQRDSLKGNSSSPDSVRQSVVVLRDQLDKVILEIRRLTGYERFLTLPTFLDVQKETMVDRPLTYVVSTEAGSLALIVSQDSVHCVWLEDFCQTKLKKILFEEWFPACKNLQSKKGDWHDVLCSVTRELWEPLVQPLIQTLITLNYRRTVLITTGYLSFLPFHSSWVEDASRPTGRRYALDDINFTYAPNARSLATSRKNILDVKAHSILAIDDPGQNLFNSEQEVRSATNRFSKTTILRHSQATIESVKNHLPDATVAHFSCHGFASFSSPLESGLLMSDGCLTLRDIFSLNMSRENGLRLAVLSACETGLQGIENLDEVISLPTGFLQAGAASVIASLWSVSDRSTMLLLSRFYELWEKDGIDADEALRKAQVWLRDSTEGEIASHAGLLTDTPDNRPYAHPYHWAAFSYTGI